MRQIITCGRKIFFAGESVTIRLEGCPGIAGHAVIRTNLGRVAVRHLEVIAHTEKGEAVPGMDWHDIRMNKCGNIWQIQLPLTEVGIFEAKCCFIPADGSRIRWAQGGNFRFKVEPASAACGNSIYSAFVRQFGANCRLEHSSDLPESAKNLEMQGFTVVPPSGTFRKLIGELDHIFDTLDCRILQLLPVHPVPVQYGKMGLYGSPFAALDYFNVDPALAEFDEKATPLEQFGELIDAVHARSGMIFMDIPVNHTGWASKLQIEHPDYFVRREDGTFESPGAWGVVWADLCKLNYREPKVHELMAKVFLFWCRRGVDGFRCDAGYMLPAEAWEYIVCRVRSEYPDTIFLLEGLGGPLAVQDILLGEKGLNWGYSELFQNYSRDEISRYFPVMERTSAQFGSLVSFAETHDNLRLASGGKVYARLRFLVCALLSGGSSFGFVNGAEFFAEEKIDVHGNGALNFGAKENLNALIRKLNRLLKEHPAFFPESHTTLVQCGPGNVIAAVRTPGTGNKKILVLLNLDCNNGSRVYWEQVHSPGNGVDLLSGREICFERSGTQFCCYLEPGEGLCIGFDSDRISDDSILREPFRVECMRRDLMAKRAVIFLTGDPGIAGACSGEELAESPVAFAEKYSGTIPAPVVTWSVCCRDEKRDVMLTPQDMLLIRDEYPFRCEIRHRNKTIYSMSSIPESGNRQHIVLACGYRNRSGVPEYLSLHISRFPEKHPAQHVTGKLVALPEPGSCRISFSGRDVIQKKKLVFCSNSGGSYALFPAAWGEIRSKYDAILAVNPDKRYPVDRRVLFAGLSAWLVTNDYSQELTSDFLVSFTSDPANSARWVFLLPAGQGCRTLLEITFSMADNGNAVKFTFVRKHHDSGAESLAGARLILRPAVEDRINHQLTQAFTGPEHEFPAAVSSLREGFDFRRNGYTLALRCDRGYFVSEPEWYYMCQLPDENYYGLEDHTDRYSPGYFEIPMQPESIAVLTAAVHLDQLPQKHLKWPEPEFNQTLLPEDFLLSSLRRFIVKRDDLSTVLAGYPWFLDWGRDTLIVLRGLVRAKEFQDEAVKIIRAFANFERQGTIPNVIRGEMEANRDTSDAPLYLIIAVRDYIQSSGNAQIMDMDCAGRPLRNVLESIVEHYMKGTPNGIQVDPESMLVFSPPHFSWMDTNFPAGTPRCGYPVEIQALWYAALVFLGFTAEAENVAQSIEKYFFLQDGRCSDCLHCSAGTPAALAVPDDHNRSNQLLLITLQAVKNPVLARNILDSCSRLLVPGGIRTLADDDTVFQLPVMHNGKLLNDPRHPYRGKYSGPEDTSRKVSYHNGTVWCWPFPAYCEALFMLGGETVRERAMGYLMSACTLFEYGAAGQLPEVADGDSPHLPGGCPAQAWSVSEFYRVYELLKVSL